MEERKNTQRYRCKFCGAKLKRDPFGLYCPTKNCQWQYGVDEETDSAAERAAGGRRCI
jgi:hypothetical protein